MLPEALRLLPEDLAAIEVLSETNGGWRRSGHTGTGRRGSGPFGDRARAPEDPDADLRASDGGQARLGWG